METTKPLEKEINHYLSRLNTREQQVVLSVIKSIAGEDEEWWNDDEYMAELDKRVAEVEGGIVKGVTMKDVKETIAKKRKSRIAKA